MDDREILLEVFAEQVICWAEQSIDNEDMYMEFSQNIIDFAKSLGLPV